MMVQMARIEVNQDANYGPYPLRTKQVRGVTAHLPEVGKPFIIVGDSLDFEGGSRMVATSVVNQISWTAPDLVVVKTQNSTYEVKILSEEDGV